MGSKNRIAKHILPIMVKDRKDSQWWVEPFVGGAKTGLYLFGCITPDRINKRQNGQRFNDGRKFYTLTTQDKHGVLIEGYIRRLTPVECERLQTMPDNFTSCNRTISNTQRYKALGNGWTCAVIEHILKGIK